MEMGIFRLSSTAAWIMRTAACVAPMLCNAQAAGAPPTVAQIIFAPATVASGVTSRLTVVLSNANAGAAILTAPLVDTLPPGLTVTAATVGGSCNAGSVIARTGAGSFSYAAGAVIPAGGCSFTISVTGSSASGNSYFADSIPAGALQTNLGASTSGASGTLTVQAAVVVPALTGLTQAAAAAALQGAGLVLGTVTHAAAAGTINTVSSQVPAARTAARAGSVVNIVISTGPTSAANPNSPLTGVPGFVDPAQTSIAAAVERVCSALSGPSVNAPSLTGLQQSLLANCKGIINAHGGGNDPAGLKNTLDAISGRQTTAQQQTGIKFASTQFTNIGARLAQLRQGASGASAAGLDMGVPGGAPIGQLLAALQDASSSDGSTQPLDFLGGASGDTDGSGAPGKWGFFINGNLRRGTQDTTNYESGFDFKDDGVTAGVDYRFTNWLVLGVAVGHSNGTTDFDDAEAHLDSRSNTASVYGTYYGDSLYIDAIGTFGHIKYNAQRSTTFSIDTSSGLTAPNCVGTECSVDVNGSTTARQFAFGTSIGYSFNAGGFVFGPDLAIDWTRVDVKGFSENDPTQSGMALAYQDQLGESLILKAGGHFSYAISTPIAVVLPQVRLRYDHEFKNDQRASTAHFVADPDVNAPGGPISNFVVFTDAPDRNYFDWALGVSAQFAFGISAYIDYSAVADETYLTSHEYSFGIRFQHLVR